MEELPIKYFDTHSHGDIMSRYTNDTDTLRQMISMSIPQAFSSLITIVSVFCAMVATSVPLTGLIVVCVFLMVKVSGKITGASAKYFVQQQASIGKVNGYIEEMMNGQKVVKVFCHEDAAKKDFDVLNDELFENADKANTFANILMPVMGNIGNLEYVLVAILGAVLMLSGKTGLTLGGLVAFLSLTKSFSTPVNQIAQQINAIIMALAGAGRIFALMDEEPEEDDGYVTLVNAKVQKGELVEADHRTSQWAWKHPHKADGTVTYVPLSGHVELDHVDFEYELNKPVLHDITLTAEPGQKIALVGATGAGKTTITNLINRFYDIADGKIRYDGININKIKSRTCAAPWAWSSRTPICSPARSWRISATATWTPPTRRSSPRPSWPTPTASSSGCPRATRLCWTATAAAFPGPVPAPVHRPGSGGRSSGHDPGRSHLQHRHPYRGPGSRRAWTG